MFSESNSTDVDISDVDWREFAHNNSDFIKEFDFFRDMAVDDPGDSSIIHARYGQKNMRENSTDFLPFFGTDIGFCSLVKPQLNFNDSLNHLPFSLKMFWQRENPSSLSRDIQVSFTLFQKF